MAAVGVVGQDAAWWREHRTALCLGLLALSLFLLLQQGAITNSDGASVYAVTRSLVEDGDFTVEPDLGVPGRDGEYYSKFGLGLSVLGVVPYVLVRPVAELHGRPDAVEQAAVATLLPLASALLIVALFALCRRLGAGVGSSILIALGAVFGTFLLVYTKEYFGEPLVALFLVLALERALAGRAAQAGLALAAGALVRPEAFAYAIGLVLFVALTRGRWALVRVVIPLIGAGAITVAYTYYRFGGGSTDSGTTGYGDEARFTSPLRGVEGFVYSPVKSIFLFAPVIILAPVALYGLWRASRATCALLGGTIVVGFLLASSVPGWDGGWTWGPRHLIAIVPVALAPCALWLESSARRAAGFVALCALGLAISAATVLVPTQAQLLDPHPPTSPKVLRQYELVPRAVRYSIEHTGDKGVGDHRRYLYLWQVGVTRELGRTGLAAAVPLTALLIVAAVWSAIALRRSIGDRSKPKEPEPRRSR